MKKEIKKSLRVKTLSNMDRLNDEGIASFTMEVITSLFKTPPALLAHQGVTVHMKKVKGGGKRVFSLRALRKELSKNIKRTTLQGLN